MILLGGASGVGQTTLPVRTSALYFFERTMAVWRLPPEIEVVARKQADTAAPAIVEGDGILPALLVRPAVRERVQSGQVRSVFLAEPDEEAILANLRRRGRYDPGHTGAELRTEARAKWLYGRWLAVERLGIPVVSSRPWGTMEYRVLAASCTTLPPE